MKLLLDTHVLLWAVNEPRRLPDSLRDVIKGSRGLWFSVASYWEICIKAAIGKLELVAHWPDMLDHALAENRIRWLPVERNHCLELLQLPHHHRDPFDRMLIAQARCEGLALATSDRRLERYPVEVVL